jgi:acetyltransferase-like isoleucine patch superfamily enzyme
MFLNTPILFLIFNRPNTTQQVFERIRQVKPKFLYVAADGPRENKLGEADICQKTRDLVLDNIDWDCEIKTLFREKNLGCKYAVSSAIDWFFEQVEEGIILEDDVIVDITFFEFCQRLLTFHKHDEKIMHISGFNISPKSSIKYQDYFYSYFGTVWGWATWARAWKYYDVELINFETYKDKVLSYFPRHTHQNRLELYESIISGKLNTWDIQWTFARLLNSGLSIIPKVNLVKNIGFSKESTHTHSQPLWAKVPVKSINSDFIFNHIIKPNALYDEKHIAFSHPKSGALKKTSIIYLFKSFIRKQLLKYSYKSFKTSDNQIPDWTKNLPININFIGSKKPKLSLGRGTYINGLTVYCWDDSISVSLGKYCAIADNVIIVAGGEHDKDWVSSYQFINLWRVEELYPKLKKRYKGDIVIGNDVWIGNNVLILSGINIGDGAVIGAGSVVVKDVPDYAVVGGNPAKLIKKRFSEFNIRQLKQIQWWNWSEEDIKESLPLFSDIDSFVTKYAKK